MEYFHNYGNYFVIGLSRAYFFRIIWAALKVFKLNATGEYDHHFAHLPVACNPALLPQLLDESQIENRGG